MTVRLGVSLPQFTSGRDRFLEGVSGATDAGIGSLWVFDHIWPLRQPERPALECWTTVAWLARHTEVHVGTLVTRSSLRHPALVAKMAATMGAIAPGRFTIALGSGDHLNRDENRSIGAPYYRGQRRIAQLVSSIEVVGRFLRTQRVDHADEFVAIDGLPATPRPDPPPPVWVGGRSPELLEVAGRIADGWNGWGADMDGFAADALKVKELAGDRSFTVSWAGQVLIRDTDAEARAAWGERDPLQVVMGSPETVRRALAGVVAAGAEWLIASFPKPTAEDYAAFATVAGGGEYPIPPGGIR